MANEIEMETRGRTAIITINRPEVHNAINDKAIAGLEDALDKVEKNRDIGSMILTGKGKDAFCSGGDLGYFKSLTSRDLAAQMSKRMESILDRFSGSGFVSIAALNGLALGGGCELVTACHFRIASSAASFSFRQAANGITTGWGGGFRLLNLLGRSTGLRLLLTSEKIDAAEALRIGFIDEVVEPDTLLDASLEMAESINQHDSRVVSAFLKMSGLIDNGEIEPAKSFESEAFLDLFASPEFRKFLEQFTRK